MGEVIKTVLAVLNGGGSEAVIALLLIIVAYLGYSNYRLQQDFRNKDERTDKVVEDYHTSNSILTEAIQRLNQLISEIKNKL
ncbi:hypothetical protein FDI40_gp048 [Agrobacterium phage Atu_ph07]|uniref:Holin n=1 Tax=Agrobacterium phage Atu_ph07 TaxID=2024264 RepID=A0A2L0UZD0_9CAUD|nr:hypothetical protein FDI40_gp048 [Agrobacterium phage Atu_ph07]AUZ94860.1 hypothetical protein [Agrobacterium phage Atu_ph07]